MSRKPAPKPSDEVHDLFVEPPLAYRLFPTLMKGRTPSAKAVERAAAKAAKKHKPLRPRLPMANLLPDRLVIETRKRDINRGFGAVLLLLVTGVAAGWWLMGGPVREQEARVAAATQELADAQAAYTSVAGPLTYADEVGEQAAFANSQAALQIDTARVAQISEAVLSRYGQVTAVAVSWGLSGDAGCGDVATGGGGLFEEPGEPVSGDVCAHFTVTFTDQAAAEAAETELGTALGVRGVTVVPAAPVDGGYPATVQMLADASFGPPAGSPVFVDTRPVEGT